MSSIDSLRALYDGKLSNMEPTLLQSHFESVVKSIQNRAFGSYTGCTEDNLTFLNGHTSDDSRAVLHGTDETRNLWNKGYASQIKDLEWRFNCLEDYKRFHLRFARKNPDALCTIALDVTVDDPQSGRRACHVDCQKYTADCCDICRLYSQLDAIRPSHGGLQWELRDCYTRTRPVTVERDVYFPGAELRVKCTFGEGGTVKLSITGKLGIALDGAYWPGYDAWGRPVRPVNKPTPHVPSKPITDMRAFMADMKRGQDAIAAAAAVRDAERERAENVPPSDAQLVCLHDVGREGYKHCAKGGICWEVEGRWKPRPKLKFPVKPPVDWSRLGYSPKGRHGVMARRAS